MHVGILTNAGSSLLGNEVVSSLISEYFCPTSCLLFRWVIETRMYCLVSFYCYGKLQHRSHV